jgi:hypothetical protein
MTQEDKNLLLRDLCARLPYGVKCQIKGEEDFEPLKLKSFIQGKGFYAFDFYIKENSSLTFKELDEFKPYLFPLSSMTEEQKIECFKGTDIELDEHNEIWSTFPISNSDIVLTNLNNWLKIINWLNKNHFDYRGLIERGLALDATGLDIY